MRQTVLEVLLVVAGKYQPASFFVQEVRSRYDLALFSRYFRNRSFQGIQDEQTQLVGADVPLTNIQQLLSGTHTSLEVALELIVFDLGDVGPPMTVFASSSIAEDLVLQDSFVLLSG